MEEESYQTYIEPEKMLTEREIERINNRFVQKIEEIKRLQAGLEMNIRNLKALAVKTFGEGYTLTINGGFFSKETETVDIRDGYDWTKVHSVVVSKKGDKLE